MRNAGLMLLALLIGLASASAAEPADTLKPQLLRVGFTQSAFLSMNRNDVEAAFKVFVETVGRKMGYRMTTRTEVFDESGGLELALKAQTIDLAIIDTWIYLAMDVRAQAPPLFVGAGPGGVSKRYLLLTRRDSGLNTLADLRGKTLAELAVPNATLGGWWLDTDLLTNGLGTRATFFSEVETVSKPTGAVLPVYFGKKQACLVDEVGFQVMKELNPQVGKELQAVAISEPLVNAVICLSTHYGETEERRTDMIRSLTDLHLEPAGQQILALFKADQLVPFEEKYLNSIKKLRANYAQALKGGPASTSSPNATGNPRTGL